MVKMKSLPMPVLLAAFTIIMSGCTDRGPLARVTAESIVLSHGPTAPFLSIAELAGTLYAVYADRATTTLDLIEMPGGPHLPSAAPAPEVIDKVDVVPPLSPVFGEHVLSVSGGVAAVLYMDRETDVKNVLKLSTRPIGQRQWDLDILEPAGDPLALVPDEKGGFGAAWASGLLSYRPVGGTGTPGVPVIPFQAQGKPCPDGAGGFTAFDSLTSSLLFARWMGTGFSTRVLDGGTPVQASLRSASGRLNVVTWDPGTRRLVLHQESAPSGKLSSVTVTLCDGTRRLALLPGQSDSTFLFVFDETQASPAGKTVYQVSTIASGSLIGARGTRYRKAVVTAGDAPIDGFAATRTTDALYVLVSQGDLRLLRIPLSPGEGPLPR
jgi:hypothetical protein